MKQCCICQKEETYPLHYCVYIGERETLRKDILPNGDVKMIVKFGQPLLIRFLEGTYYFVNSDAITENKDLMAKYEWYRKNEEKNVRSYICEECIKEMIKKQELLKDEKPKKVRAICGERCNENYIEAKEEILKKTYMPNGDVNLMVKMEEPILVC